MTDDTSDRLDRVQTAVADTNQTLARAVTAASSVHGNPPYSFAVANTHDALLDTYSDVVRALDTTERVFDDINEDYGTTPRSFVSEHADRLREQYDGPVLFLALSFLEQNRREWLHHKSETYGAEQVERHGILKNQRLHLNELQDAWDAYDPDSEDAQE